MRRWMVVMVAAVLAVGCLSLAYHGVIDRQQRDDFAVTFDQRLGDVPKLWNMWLAIETETLSPPLDPRPPKLKPRGPGESDPSGSRLADAGNKTAWEVDHVITR